jgi:hypothetical protein
MSRYPGKSVHSAVYGTHVTWRPGGRRNVKDSIFLLFGILAGSCFALWLGSDFVPVRRTTVRIESGDWTARKILYEQNRDSDGNAANIEIDSVTDGGICNPQFCTTLELPDSPDSWQPLLSGGKDSPYSVGYEVQHHLNIRDLESGQEAAQNLAKKHYSPQEYANAIPEIGSNKTVTVYLSGRLGKPRF